MIVGIFSMFVLVLYTLSGGVPTGKEGLTTVFYSPAFIISCFVMCASIAYECWIRGRSWKRVSFLLSHFSIVIICIGCLIGMFTSKKANMMMYIGPDFYYEQVPFEKHDERLDFGIGATAFHLEKYPMKTIDLFVLKEIPTPENMQRMGHPGRTVKDYVFEKSFDVADGDIKFENGTVVKLADLKVEGTDEWVAQYPVEGIGVLQPTAQMDKFYEVDFKIITKGEGEDAEDEIEIVRMEVNKPVSHGGWKFYLLDYDKRDHRYIWISARKDPGAIFVIVGCWLLMIGVSLICFGAPTLKGGKDES